MEAGRSLSLGLLLGFFHGAAVVHGAGHVVAIARAFCVAFRLMGGALGFLGGALFRGGTAVEAEGGDG